MHTLLKYQMYGGIDWYEIFQARAQVWNSLPYDNKEIENHKEFVTHLGGPPVSVQCALPSDVFVFDIHGPYCYMYTYILLMFCF